MIDVAQPASLSVYRGQARTGKGEGPEKTILHGEQYLAVDSELFENELLDAIRPWMTLDSDPADHQRLNEQLESWSVVSVADYLFVVRLVPAGMYDRRAAYFAHGRAWHCSTLPATFDPGLHLGRSVAFDQPWRDEPPIIQAEEPPSLVRPQQIAAETETAALFLGHLYQALVEDYPLIIAAPIADFVSGSPLHALVSLARAGLPDAQRRECRVRVYSRSPDLFLRHLRANLVVVPEDAAPGALSARPTGTIIDRRGQKVAGAKLNRRALDYATAVVERAAGIPDGLPFFSKRFKTRNPRELPSAAETRAVQIIYNLAFAFAGSAERRGELLRRYLPRAADKLGPGLPWDQLIADNEWREFPAEALIDQLLATSPDASAGGAEFARRLEAGASGLELSVDKRLHEWWDASDARKVRRLVELLAYDPPLVSPNAVAERTSEVPLPQLVEAERLHLVLAAEAESGLLSARTNEKSELAQYARSSEVFDVLTRAVNDGRIDPGWAQVYVQSTLADEVAGNASRWLGNPEFFQKWGKVPELLLDRFRSLPTPPASLARPVKAAAHGLNPVTDLEMYLRLADVLVRIAPAEGRSVVHSLWDALPSLSDAQRQSLEDRLFDTAWPSIDIRQISLPVLLQLAAGFRKRENDARLYAELDERIKETPKATTETLVHEDWWFFWRRRSQLRREDASEGDALRRSAFAWLNTNAWTVESKEATLEAWNAVLEDLPKKIKSSEIAGLRWPRIAPFEQEQVDQLIGRCADLGALAELSEAVPADWLAPDGISVPAYVLTKSTLQNGLDPSALAWLLKPGGMSKPSLDLRQSRYLYERAGHRQAEQGLAARIQSVRAHLQSEPAEALKAAGNPHLWSEPRFLYEVADWMNRKGSLQGIVSENAKWIDDHVDGELKTAPKHVSQDLVRELVENGFDKAARLLDPKYQHEMELERLADSVIEALVKGRAADSCWRRLAKALGPPTDVPRDDTPLRVVAARIRDSLAPEQRRKLALHGWRVFRAAAIENPRLIFPLNGAPYVLAPMLPLLDFSASMLGSGALGTAVLQLAFAVDEPEWRENMRLWQSLLRAVRTFKCHGELRSADDREQLAVALLFGCLDRPAEQDALTRAIGHEATIGWPVPVEFGVITV